MCAACTESTTAPSAGGFIATTPPISMILIEITGDPSVVQTLLPPGSSPHTYEPRPSDMAKASTARALFYCDVNLDGWAIDMGTAETVSLFELVPEEHRLAMTVPCDHEGHNHQHAAGPDPHFWLSPVAVMGILPALCNKLCELDPGNAGRYRTNTEGFREKLTGLDDELRQILEPARGEYVLTFHPSFGYLLDEYGLNLAGVIELMPGKEPTPAYLAGLVTLIDDHGVKAVFSEPQLPMGPAQTIAGETGLPCVLLDPIGGTKELKTYSMLLEHNARVLAGALAHD